MNNTRWNAFSTPELISMKHAMIAAQDENRLGRISEGILLEIRNTLYDRNVMESDEYEIVAPL